MQERTGARINVPPPSVMKDELTVAGDKDGVKKAVEEINRIYNEKRQRCQTVSTPLSNNTSCTVCMSHYPTKWNMVPSLSCSQVVTFTEIGYGLSAQLMKVLLAQLLGNYQLGNFFWKFDRLFPAIYFIQSSSLPLSFHLNHECGLHEAVCKMSSAINFSLNWMKPMLRNINGIGLISS